MAKSANNRKKSTKKKNSTTAKKNNAVKKSRKVSSAKELKSRVSATTKSTKKATTTKKNNVILEDTFSKKQEKIIPQIVENINILDTFRDVDKKDNEVEIIDTFELKDRNKKEISKDNNVKRKEYYFGLDVIRVISCIAVLLYHLGILKGGYLAVCTFFVLTGFLSCRSAFKKEKFSLLEYYKNRFIKIYIPLCIVIFITIMLVSFSTSMSWFNIKPDAKSALLGYNNFWQIGANLDYFVRHINSPFMHFWYIGILLQFELLFPFIFKILKLIGNKIKKNSSFIIPFILAIISYIFFCYLAYKGRTMEAYYNTFARSFSILLGIAFGFSYQYYGSNIKDNPIKNRLIFILYTLILLLLFIFIDSENSLFIISMMLVTLISIRLIKYTLLSSSDKIGVFERIIKLIAGISYEIYLLQYPVIYLFQFVNMNNVIKIPLIIIIILALSYLLHMCVNIKHRYKSFGINVFKYLVTFIVFGLSIYGCYKYYNLVDYTPEMKELEQMLNNNEKELQAHQEEYLNKLNEEQASWEETLNSLTSDDDGIKKIVDNLKVVGVGDSVMLGAVNNLYGTFEKGYFDAKVSRSMIAGLEIINDLHSKKMLGDVVVINLGANGAGSANTRNQIVEKCKDKKLFFITVTNDSKVHVNEKFKKLADENDNIYIIDWEAYSNGHNEYFYADKIHLNGAGRKAYTKLIYDSIYKVYKDQYDEYIKDIIKQHEEELKSKITFYGNDMLISSYSEVLNDFPEALIITDQNYNFEKIKEQLLHDKENKTLSYKVVLIFDYQVKLSKANYEELLSICDNNELYIVSVNKITDTILNDINNERLHIIDFYSDTKENKNYFMKDYIHLTDKGIKGLIKALNTINN